MADSLAVATRQFAEGLHPAEIREHRDFFEATLRAADAYWHRLADSIHVRLVLARFCE
jgi:hypothetical protein